MDNLPIYHGPIGKEEGERRLAQDGRDGCYLVRNSDSMEGVFCLCVLCGSYVYTYRIHREAEGSWTAETKPGVQKRYFRHILNLITTYQKPGQGIAMPLLYPVTAQRRAQTPGYGVLPTNGGPNPCFQQEQHQYQDLYRNQQQYQQQLEPKSAQPTTPIQPPPRDTKGQKDRKKKKGVLMPFAQH